jgi:hypothetical protein
LVLCMQFALLCRHHKNAVIARGYRPGLRLDGKKLLEVACFRFP